MQRTFDVQAVRDQFPALGREYNGRPVVYFDGPGGTQTPPRVKSVQPAFAHGLPCVQMLPGHSAAPPLPPLTSIVLQV